MNIKVDLNTPIKDGTEVVFRSPVDCSQVTGLKVYYPGSSQEFVLADAHGNNVGLIDHLFAEDVVVKVILDVTTGMAFVQNADTNAYLEGRFAKLPGEVTEDGGVVLTDCDSKHRAGEGAVATGVQGLRATDESGNSEYTDESDWRYNEAIGTGSMASGIGAVAFSKASKSLGYRTQTGYPPNPEEEAKRPEAVSGAVLSVIMLPKPVESNPSYNPFYFIDKEENAPYAVCLYLYNKITEWYGIYDLDASGLRCGAFNIHLPNTAYYESAEDYAPGDFTTAVSFLNEEGETLASYSKRANESNMEGITITGTVPQDTKQMSIQITNHMPEDAYVDGSISFYLYPADNVGQAAVAIGADTAAVGNHSLAGGYKSQALEHATFAFGRNAKATQVGATAFGQNTTASGEDSFAGGQNCVAGGTASLAMGNNTVAGNKFTTALGIGTQATCQGALVAGKYNAINGTVLFAVGNGTSDSGRVNALQVRNNGQTKIQGTLSVNDKVTVDKNGNATVGGKLTFADVDEASAKTLVNKATGQYELIEDITLEEDVLEIIRNTDINGTAYDFSAIRVFADVPASSAQSQIGISVHSTNQNSADFYLAVNGSIATAKRQSVFVVRNDRGLVDTFGTNDSNNNLTTRTKAFSLPWKNITKIRVWTYPTTVLIPAGTNIKIYGIRG